MTARDRRGRNAGSGHWPAFDAITLFGIGLTLLGVLIITPDTLLIRLSGLEGWPLTAWRGLPIGGSMLLGGATISTRGAIP